MGTPSPKNREGGYINNMNMDGPSETHSRSGSQSGSPGRQGGSPSGRPRAGSTTGNPQGYPAPLGYDPGRDPARKTEERINTRIDLPPEAYSRVSLRHTVSDSANKSSSGSRQDPVCASPWVQHHGKANQRPGQPVSRYHHRKCGCVSIRCKVPSSRRNE